jgi:hypothetical protein
MATTTDTKPNDEKTQKRLRSLEMARQARREKYEKQLAQKVESGNPFVVAPLTMPSLPMFETKSSQMERGVYPQITAVHCNPLSVQKSEAPTYIPPYIRDEGKGVFPPEKTMSHPLTLVEREEEEESPMEEEEEKPTLQEIQFQQEQKKRKRVTFPENPVSEERKYKKYIKSPEPGTTWEARELAESYVPKGITDFIPEVPSDLADYMYGIGDFLSKAGPVLGGLLICRILLSLRSWISDSPSDPTAKYQPRYHSPIGDKDLPPQSKLPLTSTTEQITSGGQFWDV